MNTSACHEAPTNAVPMTAMVDSGTVAVRSECPDVPHFYWRGSSQVGVLDGGIVAVKHLDVRRDADWFELGLHDDALLRGVRAARHPPGTTGSRPFVPTTVLLPATQGRAVLTVAGLAQDCALRRPIIALGGPFQAQDLDATRDWRFEVVSADGGVLLAF